MPYFKRKEIDKTYYHDKNLHSVYSDGMGRTINVYKYGDEYGNEKFSFRKANVMLDIVVNVPVEIIQDLATNIGPPAYREPTREERYAEAVRLMKEIWPTVETS